MLWYVLNTYLCYVIFCTRTVYVFVTDGRNGLCSELWIGVMFRMGMGMGKG